MARKPVTRMNAYNNRQAVWRVIRTLRTQFSVADLRYDTALGLDTIRDYVTGLSNGGYLKKDGEREVNGRISTLYTLINDVGTAAPRVRKNGTLVTQGRGNQLMWRTMKVLGTFTARDLALTASLEECQIKQLSASSYCQQLHKAGYLAVAHGGKSAAPALYRLIPNKYTGPQAPMIQKIKQIFDPNLGEVVWPKQNGKEGTL